MLLRRFTEWPTLSANPFDELDRMKRRMDWLLGGLSRGVYREPMAGVFPLMNLTEDKDHYYVRAELPGIKAQDLDISVTADSFSVSGERKIQAEDAHAQYHRRERESGKFNRIISLEKRVNVDKVEARCKDGVLNVILPKAEETKPKQITIKAV